MAKKPPISQTTGAPPKIEYEIPFDLSAEPLDSLRWNSQTVHVKVQQGNSEKLFPLKSVKVISDSSRGVLEFHEPKIAASKKEAEFDVEIKEDAIAQMKPLLHLEQRNPRYNVDVEIEVDLGESVQGVLSQVMGAAIPVPGVAGTAAAAASQEMAVKLPGKTSVLVEFPYPFVWHQLMDAKFNYNGNIPYEIDTDNESGVQVGLNLREFAAKGGGNYQPGQEKLEVKKEGDGLDLLDDIIVNSTKMTLKARRVLIGERAIVERADNRVKLIPTWNPPPGSKKKPARNQSKINNHPPTFQFKAYMLRADISVFQKKPDKKDEMIQTFRGVHFTGETIKVNCRGRIPSDFQGFIQWKIVGETPKRYANDFHLNGQAALSFDGDNISADISLLKTGKALTRSEVKLTVQMILHLKDLSIQISKTGWRTPSPIHLSPTDEKCAEFFKALEQGYAALTFRVPHDLKERFEGLEVPDTVCYPEVKVIGMGDQIMNVTHDSQGLVTCHLGSESSAGYSLDISDQISPLEIEPAVLEPIRKLENQGQTTGRKLQAFESKAAKVLEGGLKDIRKEYFNDYVVLPGSVKGNEHSIESTAESRKYAILSLSLMMDACNDTPELYRDCEHNYAISFRSAVSHVFSATLDSVLFLVSLFQSTKLIKAAQKAKRVAVRAAEEGVEQVAGEGVEEAVRAGGDAVEEGVDQTARTGVDAVEEGTEQTARTGADAGEEGAEQVTRTGAETAEEGAEDISKLGPKELEERLAKNKAEKDAAEKTIQEMKEKHPNIGHERTIKEAAKEDSEQLLKEAKQTKEALEEELRQVKEALEKSKEGEGLLTKAEKEFAEQEGVVKGLKERTERATDLINNRSKKVASLQKEADKAMTAIDTLKGQEEEFQKALNRAAEKVEQLAKELEKAKTFIHRSTHQMKDMTKQEVDHTIQLINRYKTRVGEIENGLLPQAEKSLGTPKKQFSEVTQNIASQDKVYRKTLKGIEEAKNQLAKANAWKEKLVKETSKAESALETADGVVKKCKDDVVKLESSSDLSIQQRDVNKKLESCKDSIRAAEKRFDKCQKALDEFNDNVQKLHDNEQLFSKLSKERTTLQERQRLINDALDKGFWSPTMQESGKACLDDKHYVRTILYGIPGIGQILFVMDMLPELIRLAVKCTVTLMDWIGSKLGKLDDDVTEFSRKLENALKSHHVKVNVQPVFGPKKDWVVNYQPRPNDRYLDPVNRAQAKKLATQAVSQKGRNNRKTLKRQTQNNILSSLTDAFVTACAYKPPPKKGLFTSGFYAQAEHQTIGGENVLRKLISEEKYSQKRADVAYGWDLKTLGTTTWTDIIRILDWFRWFFAWGIRIFAILAAIGTFPTGWGPVGFALVFLSADGIDAFANTLKAIIAVWADARSKAMYLQLAVNYPCLAQAWIFEGMKEFSPQDIEAVSYFSGLDDFHSSDVRDISRRLDFIKAQVDAHK